MIEMEEYLQAMYLQLAESIKKKIIEGVYNEGDAIPSEREIAKMYDVNRMTVKRAIMQCVNDGYLYRIQGKGTFVCEGIKLEAKGKIKLGEGGTKGLSSSIRLEGKTPSSKVIDFSEVRDDYIELMFNDTNDKEFYRLSRIRYADNEKIAYQISYFPTSIFEDADRIDFKNIPLYDYMDYKRHMPMTFKKVLQVVLADDDVSKKLGINKNECVFLIEFKGYDSSDRLVEYTLSYHRPEISSFQYYSYSNN